MELSVELVLLATSFLFFLSLLAGKAGYRFGVPALLLFLMVGMLGGSDGLGIRFESTGVTQVIGTIALSIILFSGGLDTKIADIKPVMYHGILLATLGVLLTALFTGLFIWWILGMTHASAGIGFISSLLMASTMSSTDSASVFSILRSKGLHLKHNLRPMLELESGSNDPMAYVLTISAIELLRMGSTPNYGMAVGMLLFQLAMGALLGYLLGRLAVYIANHIKIDNSSLYPILLVTICLFIFSSTHFLKGNAYLAVYMSGLVIGNSRFIHKRSSLNFFDGLAWLSQLLMFLTLGLLVNPSELVQKEVLVPGLIISLIMIFVTRPLGVFISLLPFPKMPLNDKVFISWVGLRGAVPIIFAIIALEADVPHARLMFNIVFFCTLVSLLVQGTTLPRMANLLNLVDRRKKVRALKDFDVEFSDEIKSVATEIKLNAQSLSNGYRLMDLPLPERTLVVMVKRNDKFFIPTGTTVLCEDDKLLIITDNHDVLVETLRSMGVHD